MRNIAIVETNETLTEFLSNIRLSKDVAVWTYEDILIKKDEFILSENTVLVIEQNEELKNIELNMLNYFSMNNTVFILTYNFSLLRQRYKKEYFLLRPLIGLIYEGNTIIRFGTIYNSSS
ncbi:hypothetical protein [Enterococcus termitis]|uniref:Uncharacterized protein n=1 Tax=Enterococcus termitis TaxID=332950 RepID=A0A1E5GJR7_9ENTE|nr:hypothetical protein [Enterococcus termitis]OEG12948.1 hypothetical protein BCR25_05520 [Enterococcus termitis]